jgi:hypothetical protein
MQSKSNSPKSLSSRNEDSLYVDLSPVSENKLIREGAWFLYNPKKQSSQQPGNTVGAKKLQKGQDLPQKRWGHSSVIYNKSMIIFGGRHSHRSLANLYSFDLVTNQWTKLEPLGQTPPARDSHSAIMVSYL